MCIHAGLAREGGAVSGDKDYNITLNPDENGVWLVALLAHQKYTTRCCRQIEEAFEGCRCYVPVKETLHVYANRTKRHNVEVHEPSTIFEAKDGAYK